MNARQAIKESMNTPNMIVHAYLEDLSDEELLVRPVEGPITSPGSWGT